MSNDRNIKTYFSTFCKVMEFECDEKLANALLQISAV